MTAWTQDATDAWFREEAAWCAAHPGQCHLCHATAGDPERDLALSGAPSRLAGKGLRVHACRDSGACSARMRATGRRPATLTAPGGAS